MPKSGVLTRGRAFLHSCFRWDRPFIRKLLFIALPMMLQDLLAASLHIVDGLMVSGLGDTAYSAVVQANRFSFIFQLFAFGISSGGAIFFSQYWGARDIRRIHHAMGLALVASLLLTLLFTLGGLLFPGQIVALFLRPGESYDLAVAYLKIVAPGYLLIAVNSVYASALKSTEKTFLPMLSGMGGILTNTLLNYAFIYGKLGAPQLGVEGAALATVIAQGVTLAITLSFAYGKRLPAGPRLRHMLCWDRPFIRRFIKTVIPVILNEGLWALGTTVYSMFYGRMGDMSIAAIGVCTTINDLVWVALMATTNAAGIMVGKALGEGNASQAYLYGKRLLAGGFAAGLLLGIGLAFVRIPLTGLFSGLSPATREKAQLLLLISAGGLCLRAINCINVVGVLRSGGDTLYSLVLEVTAMWGLSVPLVGIGILALGWPIESAYLCTLADEVVKLAFGIPRFTSRKWMHSITLSQEVIPLGDT